MREALAALASDYADRVAGTVALYTNPVVPPSSAPSIFLPAGVVDPNTDHMPLRGNFWWASISKDRYAYRLNDGTHWYIRRNELVPGEWLEIEGALEFCSNGIHVSRTVLDRWGYASENYLALMEVDPTDDYDTRDDRSVYRRGRVVRIWERSQFFEAVQAEYNALPGVDRCTTHYGQPCYDTQCLACLRELSERHPGLLSRIERRLLAMPPVISVPF